MTEVGQALAAITNKDGVLKLVYDDLARPGVRQVGKALETVLQLGNSLLLPLRLINETAKKFEERKFSDIADRLSKIPEEDIVDVRPEIGLPILDKLSEVDDGELRRMFIELLAKAATSDQIHKAHPSFVSVISSITPDEAILLKSLVGSINHPVICIKLLSPEGSSRVVVHDLVMLPPDGLLYPDNVPLYISNLSGLGILEVQRDTWLAADGAYDATTAYAKKHYGLGDEVLFNGQLRKVEYTRDLVNVLPYGVAFLQACIL